MNRIPDTRIPELIRWADDLSRDNSDDHNAMTAYRDVVAALRELVEHRAEEIGDRR